MHSRKSLNIENVVKGNINKTDRNFVTQKIYVPGNEQSGHRKDYTPWVVWSIF